MDSLETLETLVAQIKRGDEQKDSNLVINSLESISLLADQMRKSAQSSKDKELFENLKNSDIEKKASVGSPIISNISLDQLNDLKRGFSGESQQEDMIEAVGELDERKQDFKPLEVQKVDSVLLKGFTIVANFKSKFKEIIKLSKEELNLLRQEILMQKNTVNFRNFMLKESEKWKKPKENQQETNSNSTKPNLMDILVEKKALNGMNINRKVVGKHTPLLRKTSEEVVKFKETLKNKIDEIKRNILTQEIEKLVIPDVGYAKVK